MEEVEEKEEVKKEMEEEISFCENADEYIKKIEELISELTPEEKIEVLFKKVKYWYWSAIDWRDSVECMNPKRRGKDEEE